MTGLGGGSPLIYTPLLFHLTPVQFGRLTAQPLHPCRREMFFPFSTSGEGGRRPDEANGGGEDNFSFSLIPA